MLGQWFSAGSPHRGVLWFDPRLYWEFPCFFYLQSFILMFFNKLPQTLWNVSEIFLENHKKQINQINEPRTKEGFIEIKYLN